MPKAKDKTKRRRLEELEVCNEKYLKRWSHKMFNNLHCFSIRKMSRVNLKDHEEGIKWLQCLTSNNLSGPLNLGFLPEKSVNLNV